MTVYWKASETEILSKHFNQSPSYSELSWAVIVRNNGRKPTFLSHWHSGRLLHKITIVNKLDKYSAEASMYWYQRYYKDKICEDCCLLVTASFAFCVITFEPIEVQTRSAPQNDRLNLSFVKDRYVDGGKLASNGGKTTIYIY